MTDKPVWASTAYAISASLLAILALLHMASAWRLQTATAATRVWFFGTGIAMAQGAALNFLHRRYGHGAPGLRWTTRAFNLLTLLFAAVAGVVTGVTAAELAFLLGLLGVLFLLSLTRPRVSAPAPRR